MDLTVIVTYRCNSMCSMCNIWKNPTDPHGEIQLRTLEKLPGGFDNLNITGGEPSLRRDLPEIVEVLYPKAKKLEISSNGLHAERLGPIITAHPDVKVRFSLEGLADTNNSIRGEPDGFRKKVEGLKRLKELGGVDLGFGAVIQDDNIKDLMTLYMMTRQMGVEFATSALHNAFQFHKSDNVPYNRVGIAKEIEKLITAMLKTSSPKTWFRAYLNLGLIEKVLGHDRLLPCTAATDFAFIDPWSDVYACNVRPDLLIGNLASQSWNEIYHGPSADKIRRSVAQCSQNCWMVTTARTAMRNRVVPSLPKGKPLFWVLYNKLRVSLGLRIEFERYIDYATVRRDPQIPVRQHYLGIGVKRTMHRETSGHYAAFGAFYNR